MLGKFLRWIARAFSTMSQKYDVNREVLCVEVQPVRRYAETPWKHSVGRARCHPREGRRSRPPKAVGQLILHCLPAAPLAGVTAA